MSAPDLAQENGGDDGNPIGAVRGNLQEEVIAAASVMKDDFVPVDDDAEPLEAGEEAEGEQRIGRDALAMGEEISSRLSETTIGGTGSSRGRSSASGARRKRMR